MVRPVLPEELRATEVELAAVHRAMRRLGLYSGRTMSSRAVCRAASLRDGEAQPRTRSAIAELVRRGIPIGACSGGYFLLRAGADLDEYVADLEARSDAILDRARDVRAAFLRFWEGWEAGDVRSHDVAEDGPPGAGFAGLRARGG